MIGDVTMTTAAYAMRGLATRQDVRADNLANANTPEFRAGAVDFESRLRDALRDGRIDRRETGGAMSVSHTLPGPHQNLVDVEGEMVGMMRDQLLRNAMVNSYNFKVTSLRTAIGAR